MALRRPSPRLVFWLLLALGIAVRLWRFGAIPGGINQDEAYAGYEAWCLLHGGVDSNGYPFPVYFVSWGSGMNVLESYLMLPFVALFGLHSWVIRLPQLLLGCLSLPAFYWLFRRLFGVRTACIALFFLAIDPWHIMLCRWGLESNLAPALLLFGLCFFVRAWDNAPRFLLPAVVCYGLSLYCYATIWPIVPLLLLGQGLLLLAHDRRTFLPLVRAALLFALLALPLLLFLLVNRGILPEIVTPFLSIPRLNWMRSGELNLSHAGENFGALLRLLWHQWDGLPGNVIVPYGIHYPLMLLPAALGAVAALRQLVQLIRRRELSPVLLLFLQPAVTLLLGLLVDSNINRVNCLHLWTLSLIVLGVDWLGTLLHRHLRHAVLLCYTVLFVLFCRTYFTEYPAQSAGYFQNDLPAAVQAALAQEGEIAVTRSVVYSKIAFLAATDPAAYRSTVRYDDPHGAWRNALVFDRWQFGSFDESCGTWLLTAQEAAALPPPAGYTTASYGDFVLYIRT